MPIITVIIPTFNRERFVVKALDSVLQQSFRDYEIVVIDDGSTDDTRKVLEPYANRIRYIYQDNSGVSSARNAGIKAARGEWVAFLDSDDEWTREYLASQAERIRTIPHAVAHITNLTQIARDGARVNHFANHHFLDTFEGKQFLVYERPLSGILTHELWWLQALIIRKDVLLQAGLFDTHLSIAEDLDVVARVALRGAFTFCRHELVEIYRREEKIENLVAQSLKRGIYRAQSFGKVYANLQQNKDVSARELVVIKRLLSCNLRALGNVLVNAGKQLEARESYKKSFLVHPSPQSLIKYGATFLHEKISRVLAGNVGSSAPEKDMSL